MRAHPFSMCVDGSNNFGLDKMNPIVEFLMLTPTKL